MSHPFVRAQVVLAVKIVFALQLDDRAPSSVKDVDHFTPKNK